MRTVRSSHWPLSPLAAPQGQAPWQRLRQAKVLSFNLPLVLWWALLVGLVTFGSLLNVFMSARIAEARIQLYRLNQDYVLREEINAELLYRIGQETSLNRVAIWAQNRGFVYQSDVTWLPADAWLPAQDAAPLPAGPDGLGAPRTSSERIRDANSRLAQFWGGLVDRLSTLNAQLRAFTLLPPDLQAPAGPSDADVSPSLLERLWGALQDAANASAS